MMLLQSFRVLTMIFSCSVGLAISYIMSAPSPVQRDVSPGTLARTPPMGWNSWDGYGTTINESQFKANAEWFAEHLRASGWQYVVIDMEWSVTNPTPEGNSQNFGYSMDEYGRYVPPVSRFPSAAGGRGFTQLGLYVHARGMKLGIHILRGIPRKAVQQNLPIVGSAYHAADVANTSDICPWNSDNYGIDAAKPAGQAYYDSIAQLYATWGVDFIKVDCISSGPYKGDDIQSLSSAIAKTKRPIVLSLSPGPSPLDKADELVKYAQMWRISNDIWDIWHNQEQYPKGVADEFENAAKWAPFSQPGHWPDADMLPLGRLGPAPGWGKPRDTRLSHDEQRTLVTLWSIFRSPLMVGGDLSVANNWTLSLLTNPEVIAVDQHASASHPIVSTDRIVVWLSKPESGGGYYLAAFNRSSESQTVHYGWKDLGLSRAEYKMRDLWERKDLDHAASLTVTLNPHASVLYRLSPI